MCSEFMCLKIKNFTISTKYIKVFWIVQIQTSQHQQTKKKNNITSPSARRPFYSEGSLYCIGVYRQKRKTTSVIFISFNELDLKQGTDECNGKDMEGTARDGKLWEFSVWVDWGPMLPWGITPLISLLYLVNPYRSPDSSGIVMWTHTLGTSWCVLLVSNALDAYFIRTFFSLIGL